MLKQKQKKMNETAVYVLLMVNQGTSGFPDPDKEMLASPITSSV